MEQEIERQRELEEESKTLNYKPRFVSFPTIRSITPTLERYADDERMNERMKERDRWGAALFLDHSTSSI